MATPSADRTPSGIESGDHPEQGLPAVLGYVGGAVVGGTLGAAIVIAITSLIKEMLVVGSRQEAWVLALPVAGVALATVVLHVVGRGEPVQRLAPPAISPAPRRRSWGPWTWLLARIPDSWLTFRSDVARADLTGDVVASAGSEEKFPWQQAPLRTLAIVLTVGSGAPMGTEAPAAHLGEAAGSWIGQLRPGLRWMQRGAAIAGGAAGVSALMGVPLVGPVFMLELGRRRRVPLRLPRVAAAVVGGLIGWSFNAVLDLDLIRLIVPSEAPPDVWRALQACLYVGTSAGLVTGVAGWAIYRARNWRATAVRRLLIGAAAMLMISVVLAMIGGVQAAYGPGGGAIVWAESEAGREAPSTILIVAVLRAAATTAAVAAGGCGGVFVPFLAIGDLAARAFAPGLGVSADLAGAAGAASGIAGGYRLPWTAVAMVVSIGGPVAAVLTSLGSVVVASIVGAVTVLALDRLRDTARRRRGLPAAPH